MRRVRIWGDEEKAVRNQSLQMKTNLRRNDLDWLRVYAILAIFFSQRSIFRYERLARQESDDLRRIASVDDISRQLADAADFPYLGR